MTHDHLLIGAIVLLVVLLVGVLVTLLGVDERLTRLDRHLEALNRPPPNFGGRMPPSAAELAAARNRMDAMGIAHPGSATGPDKG